MARVLVVYYSRTGTTKRVAARIADVLGADLEAIVDPTPRSGVLGYLRSGYEATFRRRAQRVAPPAKNPAAYEVVIVGSPVWNASVSSPVRAYLEDARPRLKQVAFFCTCGGRGGERALEQMAEIACKEPSATMILREATVERAAIDADVQRFARQVRGAVPRYESVAASPAP